MPETHERAGSAVRGTARLAFDAVEELTRIVEGMHANIAAASPPLGEGTDGYARGISGLVYRSIRGINRAAGLGVDGALALLDRPPLGNAPLPQPHWDAVLGALNGVVGDQLVERENPLAIPMQLRREGRPIQSGSNPPGTKLLLLVHGLCMNDRQWDRKRHDHGAALARDLGYTPVYLFYNSGRHISENGRALSALLEGIVAEAGTPFEELTILAHSMGGLVARSACQVADEDGHTWKHLLRRIIFLGTPHHGAPLERVGSWVQSTASLSPYVAPLARLGMLRSAGIRDLGQGSVLDEDWRGRDSIARGSATRRTVALPDGVACYAIAGALSASGGGPSSTLHGDGLVPVESALGRHADPRRTLTFPEEHQWVADAGHLDLLSRPEVYEVIRSWLSD